MNRLYKKLFIILGVTLLFSLVSRPVYAGQDDHSFFYFQPSPAIKGQSFLWNVVIDPGKFSIDATFAVNLQVYGNDQWNENKYNQKRDDGTVLKKQCSNNICNYIWTGTVKANSLWPQLNLRTYIKRNIDNTHQHFVDGQLHIYYGVGGDFQRHFSQDIIIE